MQYKGSMAKAMANRAFCKPPAVAKPQPGKMGATQTGKTMDMRLKKPKAK